MPHVTWHDKRPDEKLLAFWCRKCLQSFHICSEDQTTAFFEPLDSCDMNEMAPAQDAITDMSSERVRLG